MAEEINIRIYFDNPKLIYYNIEQLAKIGEDCKKIMARPPKIGENMRSRINYKDNKSSLLNIHVGLSSQGFSYDVCLIQSAESSELLGYKFYTSSSLEEL